ncbi:MAG: bifunctional (p)ppGpp synthetase/guanosine-3',5'-bis(diphosphate) 3'-pyrophosphohydrolase [Dehalococcoidia bacterium]|nr:bifunctional (p)ppGpp synthetase/guanosine-3',5'-bis(diphosphate) 3'-pyrophosphohydrolase [Dehalococcoidia bacterium]
MKRDKSAAIDELLSKAGKYLLSDDKLRMIERAYYVASQAHEGQKRLSGEPYISHPLETALILADLRMDASSLCAALLHDVVEDSDVPLSRIEDEFGAEVARLVDGVTKLNKVVWRIPGGEGEDVVGGGEKHAENVRRMLVAMAEDIRVVFIKLADRLHNMRTLDALPARSRRRIARETLEIYAPLAHRLGIWEVKGILEDLAFSYTDPVEYRRIEGLVAKKGAAGMELVTRAIESLESELDKMGIKAELSGRQKNIYSVHQKMKKYASQGRNFGEIDDLIALRVLVDKVEDCYRVLGIIHGMWHPVHGGFDDYIANPKDNNYQSLHSVVMCFGTTPLEVQIRTYEMHRRAEYGIAAHWVYKEGAGSKSDVRFEERISWLRQLVEWHRELSGSTEFLESVRTDIFDDQVFVYTPKGEIKDLPAGSTPLDFAYRIHSELGHRCIGAKINGRLTSLNTPLSSGDTVEVIVGKRKGPSRDWLNANLGYVKTSQARQRIRQWFKKEERGENIERGKEILSKELHRMGITVFGYGKIALLFRFNSEEDFYAAIGFGEISPHQITHKLLSRTKALHVLEKDTGKPAATLAPASDIQVLGVGNMLTHLANCCHPVPGDEIVGYITRGRGVSVHRKNCPNIVHEGETERLIPVEWGRIDRLYPVTIRLEAWDRVGLARDISSVVAGEAVNISRMSIDNHDDYTTTVFLVVETRGIEQLSNIIANLEGVSGVESVNRSMGAGAQGITGESIDAYGVY